MYKYKKPKKTTLKVNKAYQGETIEQKVQRITQTNEPIKDGAPQIFTQRKDGVVAATDIRTDRFEIAIDAMDYVQRSKMAQREARSLGEQAKEGMNKENFGGAESTQGTDK